MYYFITDYVVLHAYLVFERPSYLEVTDFCNYQLSHIHNRELRNWISSHPIRIDESYQLDATIMIYYHK